MAESLADRLKRIADEKKAKAAAESAPALVALAPEVTNNESGLGSVRGVNEAEDSRTETGTPADKNPQAEQGDSETGTGQGSIALPDSTAVSVVGKGDGSNETGSTDGSGIAETADTTVQVAITTGDTDSSSDLMVSGKPSNADHPLAMEFAELEAALLAKDPEFKVTLRKVHRHLGQEPELVTMMTEEEVQMIVGGLILFANAEIVKPAAEKSVKAAVAASKKKVISADDL